MTGHASSFQPAANLRAPSSYTVDTFREEKNVLWASLDSIGFLAADILAAICVATGNNTAALSFLGRVYRRLNIPTSGSLLFDESHNQLPGDRPELRQWLCFLSRGSRQGRGIENRIKACAGQQARALSGQLPGTYLYDTAAVCICVVLVAGCKVVRRD